MSTEIDLDGLPERYVHITDDLKAKLWEGDDGRRRLYIRARSPEDRRRFDEYYIELPQEEGDA